LTSNTLATFLLSLSGSECLPPRSLSLVSDSDSASGLARSCFRARAPTWPCFHLLSRPCAPAASPSSCCAAPRRGPCDLASSRPCACHRPCALVPSRSSVATPSPSLPGAVALSLTSVVDLEVTIGRNRDCERKGGSANEKAAAAVRVKGPCDA
jgi:hypothetical protein